MNQQPQPQPTSLYPVERGDELSLIELWKVLVEYKLLIIVFTALTTLGAIYYASTLPTIYKAKVLMIPASNFTGGGVMRNFGKIATLAGMSVQDKSVGVEGERALARLKTRLFLVEFIEEQNLKPILFENHWDQQKKQWKGSEPSDEDAYNLMYDAITTKMDGSHTAAVIALRTKWKNLKKFDNIGDITNNLIHKLNNDAKVRLIYETKQNIRFLNKELSNTDILNAKAGLYNLIEQQTGKLMTANIRSEFIFKIIDPAISPIRAESKNQSVIILIGLFLGLFFGSFIAFIIDFFKSQKIKN